MENEIVLNEAIIEEREQGIREIQKEIGEVNDIFRDLAQLVSAQGSLIGDISSNIESSHASTCEAANQLTKASNTQRSTSSMVCGGLNEPYVELKRLVNSQEMLYHMAS